MKLFRRPSLANLILKKQEKFIEDNKPKVEEEKEETLEEQVARIAKFKHKKQGVYNEPKLNGINMSMRIKQLFNNRYKS